MLLTNAERIPKFKETGEIIPALCMHDRSASAESALAFCQDKAQPDRRNVDLTDRADITQSLRANPRGLTHGIFVVGVPLITIGRKTLMKKLMVATFLATVVIAGAAQAAVQTFANPRISGVRLDWCLYWARACGKPAADAFCQQRGFAGALNFSKAPNVGYRQPTRLITGQVCDANFCAGFRHITCAG